MDKCVDHDHISMIGGKLLLFFKQKINVLLLKIMKKKLMSYYSADGPTIRTCSKETISDAKWQS